MGQSEADAEKLRRLTMELEPLRREADTRLLKVVDELREMQGGRRK